MKNKIWIITTTAHLPITPIAEETTKALNDFSDKTWPIYKLTNTDMKQVTMTLETARGLYKDATPEMKKWLEENFKKAELVNDYTPPSNVYTIMNKYGINTITPINTPFANKLRTSAKLLCLMQDYYDQTGWKREGEYYTLFLYKGRLLPEYRLTSIPSPLQFKTEQHAQKFIDAYKDLLLEYFNAK